MSLFNDKKSKAKEELKKKLKCTDEEVEKVEESLDALTKAIIHAFVKEKKL